MPDEKEQFLSLVKKDLYQIFLFRSRAHFPFFFASHPWIVVQHGGVIARYEVLWNTHAIPITIFGRIDNQSQNGHVYKNYLPPWQGIGVFSASQKLFWRGCMRGHIEGGADSVAHRMAEFIEQSAEKYPYKDTYSLMGPNSNTFVQWILNHFPECALKLPMLSIGKRFHKM